jgi:predicted transcriptional regulator
MEVFKRIEQIHLFHKLIQSESTGTPSEFAKRLHVSRSTLYNIINELKSYNASIKYSRARKTFFYTHPYKLPPPFQRE